MDTATRVQILDDAVCISHYANIIGKGMNPTNFPQTMGKIVEQTISLTLLWQGKTLNSNQLNFAWKLTLCRFLLVWRSW